MELPRKDAPALAAREQGGSGTSSRILDVAERLVQVRGFNAVSYADVAAELKITKAALHYHYPGKAELGAALIGRYWMRFAQALAAIDADLDAAPAKLDRYAALYLDVMRRQRMCLCGVLAAEYQTLPEEMQDAVIRFFDQNETWVQGVLEQGREEGSLRFPGSALDVARMIVSGLEGAMLVARPYDDLARFQQAAEHLLSSVVSRTGPGPTAARPI
jgi:TetR/AcrR family transcriptional repressor of nem operon